MAKNGFKVFDSDMHVLEPLDLWQRYIDPEFKDRAPKGVGEVPMDFRVEVDGIVANMASGVAWESTVKRQDEIMDRYAEDLERNFDGVAQEKAMDKEGIDVTVLYPTRGLYANWHQGMDAKFSAAIALAYNDWLYDHCQQGDPKRMYGAASVPIQDVGMAIEEARRAVTQLGFKAILVRPNPPQRGVYYHQHTFDPLWEAVQALGVPVGFHEGSAANLPQVGADRFGLDEFNLMHTSSHAMEQMLALSATTLGGVLERFPRLKMAYLEGNGSWLPWWLWRLDEHAEGYPEEGLKMKPSDYFYRQGYVSLEADETPGIAAIEACGADYFVFSTDYPHSDAKYPYATQVFLDSFPIGEENQRKILWDNCARLYSF